MYDSSLTRQSLPDERYLYLLGVAISVFNSNNGFIIENIVRTNSINYDWYKLIDLQSGRLRDAIHNTITGIDGPDIENLFIDIVKMRNRIIHGFRITSSDGKQILATRNAETGAQFEITEAYLEDFIHKNDELSARLHKYRGN